MTYRGGYKQLFQAAELLARRGVFDDSEVCYPKEYACSQEAEKAAAESKVDEFVIPFPPGTYNSVVATRLVGNKYNLAYTSEIELFISNAELLNVGDAPEEDVYLLSIIVSEFGEIKYEGKSATGKKQTRGIIYGGNTRGATTKPRIVRKPKPSYKPAECKPSYKPAEYKSNSEPTRCKSNSEPVKRASSRFEVRTYKSEELLNTSKLQVGDNFVREETKGVVTKSETGANIGIRLGDEGSRSIQPAGLQSSRPVFRAPGGGDICGHERKVVCRHRRTFSPYTGNM